jgi:flagellar motor switch/type III secretory pathway protein FliN
MSFFLGPLALLMTSPLYPSSSSLDEMRSSPHHRWLVPAVYPLWQLHQRLEQSLETFWGYPVRFALHELTLLPDETAAATPWASAGIRQRHLPQAMLYQSLAVGDGPEASWTLQAGCSEAFVLELLEQTLGPRAEHQFGGVLPQLSELEQVLLKSFLTHVLTDVFTPLQDNPNALMQVSEAPYLQATWLLDSRHLRALSRSLDSPESRRASSGLTIVPEFTLKLPAHLAAFFPVSAPPLVSKALGDAQEAAVSNVTVLSRLQLGATRMSIADLNQLEVGDWVVLETSHPNQLAVELFLGDAWSAPYAFPIQVSGYQPKHHAPPSFSELSSSNPTQRSGGLPVLLSSAEVNAMSLPNSLPVAQVLDQVEVEVKASFLPYRMPLSQLKQMTAGLLLEVGDVLANKVELSVNGHPLAEGELLIVGDKFGVLVTALKTDESSAPEVPHTIPEGQALGGGSSSGTPPMPQQAPSSTGASPVTPPNMAGMGMIDMGLVQGLQQLGLDPNYYAQMAQASGQDVNAYLAAVLEDHRSTMMSQQMAQGANPAGASPVSTEAVELDQTFETVQQGLAQEGARQQESQQQGPPQGQSAETSEGEYSEEQSYNP